MPLNEREIFWDFQAACIQQDIECQRELARYVFECLDEIAMISHEAKQDLRRLAGDPSFYGYVSGDPERVRVRVRVEVQALYERLQQHKPKTGGELTYVLEPIDSVRMGHRQRIRLAREVLFWGHGVCLDWVLLFAACIYYAHVYPLIIVTGSHAILGYWLTEDDALRSKKDILSGDEVRQHFNSRHIGVINATRIPIAEHGEFKSFQDATGEAESHLPGAEFAVDVHAARKVGVEALRPLKPWSDNHSLPPANYFQPRDELKKIQNWWRDENSYGVLALVGIGGAGKTSLAHRFLAKLPESDIQVNGLDKDETLPIPDALFVWNFYTHRDIDRRATALYNYLTGEQVNKATFEQVQDVLTKNWRGCRILLVLDGIEKLQIALGIEPEEEDRTFGQFSSEGAPLARFLSWCCDGPRPVRAITTSRFDLTDLHRYESAGGYRTVEIEGLPRESARSLLEETLGRDDIPNLGLDGLIDEFGDHAQTLDLLGNALRIWCDSDPKRVDEIPSLEDVKKLPGVRDKAWGRVRVLRFYVQKLSYETRRLLQLLCAFEVTKVDASVLCVIVCRLSGPSIRGGLEYLSPQDVKSHLTSLEREYLLVHSMVGKLGSRIYFVHPAVRSYFWNQLPWSEREAMKKHIADYLSSLPSLASLIERVKRVKGTPVYFQPIEEAHLDELEELVRWMIKAGRVLEAWNLYALGLGAYKRLGIELGQYSRGERLARLFAHAQAPVTITADPMAHLAMIVALERTRREFFNERGIYAFSLGMLKTAVACYRGAIEMHAELEDIEEICVSCANLCETHITQGCLPRAVSAAAYALDTAGPGIPDKSIQSYSTRVPQNISENQLFNQPALYDQLVTLSAYVAYALLLRGQTTIAVKSLIHAISYFTLLKQRPEEVFVPVIVEALAQRTIDKSADLSSSGRLGTKREIAEALKLLSSLPRKGILMSIAGVYQGVVELRRGHIDSAAMALQTNKHVCQLGHLHRDVARCDLLLAEIALLRGEFDRARDLLTDALIWGIRAGDQEVLVWGNLIRARLTLDTGDLDETERAIREGLRIAEYCAYGLYWIDLQIVKGQWESACGLRLQERNELPTLFEAWTPQQWFERAEASTRRALNGQLKNSDEPALRPDLPEQELVMLGARHPECGYAWGEGDALHLLGEVLLEQGRYEEAEQRLQDALALRQRIQDPKAKGTHDLLEKIQSPQGGIEG